MKSNLLKIILLLLVLPMMAFKKEKQIVDSRPYFKGKLGKYVINAKTSFFYIEDGIGTITGITTINGKPVTILFTYILPKDLANGNYFYSVEGQEDNDQKPGASVLVVTFPGRYLNGALSYYEDCTGKIINSTGAIKVGKIEVVGKKEYITGSFKAAVYVKIDGCSYEEDELSIDFRVPNRNDFG